MCLQEKQESLLCSVSSVRDKKLYQRERKRRRNYLPKITKENSCKELNPSLLIYCDII